MVILKQIQAVMLSVVVATSAIAAKAPQTSSAAEPTQDLRQLVAPIALYPDALVGQILAGATYPTQVVDAARWIRDNPGLKGEQLAAEVDKQPWDPSVKALTQFPSVLDNMNQNLSWTSALGDAYFNDPQGVMGAIQALRADAKRSGALTSTPEQTVTTEGQTIVIQPANPEVVYVPQYSPATVYGTTIAPYPGYSGWDVAGASLLSFGLGTAVGAAVGGWGWGHWGMNWHGGTVNFNRNAYVSHSNAFVNRNAGRYGAYRGGAYGGNYANRNVTANRAGDLSRSYAGRNQAGQAYANRERQSASASRGFGQAGQFSRGTNSGALSGFRQGGTARMDSSRGQASFGGARSAGGSRSFGGGGRSFGGGGRGGGGRR
jgi:Protein of unknown function (DUF3300)